MTPKYRLQIASISRSRHRIALSCCADPCQMLVWAARCESIVIDSESIFNEREAWGNKSLSLAVCDVARVKGSDVAVDPR